MNYLDFAQGYKTIAGILVLILSWSGNQVSDEEILEIITGIGQVVGLALAIYGLIMKLARKLKDS